jgi:POT family proton-dependent oligopeptide transporter
MTKKNHLKQPSVFYLAFLTSIFERFGFYILTFLLVLYAKSLYGFTDIQAFILFGAFNALVYLMPAIGGYVADNIFGIRRSLVYGLFLEGTGLICLAMPGEIFFWFGLALVIIGVGFFKTAPTNLLGRSYKEQDPRIDSGFTLYYMSINLGGFFSPFVAGIMQKYYGWHVAFLIAGLVVYLGLLFYCFMRHTANNVDSKPGQERLLAKTRLKIISAIVIGLAVCSFLMYHPILADIFFAIITILLLCYFLYEIFNSEKQDKFKIIACVLLILIGLAFQILYFEQFTSVILFIKRSLIHNIMGFDIPPVMFLTLNTFWILALSPILSTIYKYLGKHGKDLAVTTKFPLGLLIISLSFLSLKLSTLFANPNSQVSPIWIVLFFILYSLGELLVAALGVAMVARIAPKRMYGVMMGSWFLLALALGSSISSLLAGLSSVPKTLHDPYIILNIYGTAFLKIGLLGLGFTIIAFIAAPYIKRMAKLS